MMSAPNYRLSVATAIHKGDREYQQDKVEVLQHPYNKHCIMVLVADGMGGRSGGAMASQQVIESAREQLRLIDVAKDDPIAMLRQVVSDAHTVIRLLKVSSELDPHSTIAAHVVLPNGACHWIHSGDSRIYHFRKGRLLSRTRDHSYVQELIDQGKLSPDQAVGHSQSNLLTSCLGMDIDLSGIGASCGAAALFSESQSRFVVTVRRADAEAFEEALAGSPVHPVGCVTAEPVLSVRCGDGGRVEADIMELKHAWKSPLAW